MNTIVGNFSLKENQATPETFDFDTVESLSKDGGKTIYFFGETPLKKSGDFLDELHNIFKGTITHYDISISSEDKLLLSPFDYEEGIYEVVSFEGEQVTFSEIKNRFSEVEEVISIRECENSQKFGNKIIRVDFIY